MDILQELTAERIRQDEKWGEQNNHPFVWIAVLGEEFGEASQAALQFFYTGEKTLIDYRKELIEVAAVAMAAVECLDRNKWQLREE